MNYRTAALLVVAALVLGWPWNPVGQFTPEMAVRMAIIRNAGPGMGFRAQVRRSPIVDRGYGQQVVVRGWTDAEPGGGIFFCYTKQHPWGLWYVTSCGSGP